MLEIDKNDSKDLSVGARKMDEKRINEALKNESGYLGSYALDELKDLKVSFYPSFIVLNLDFRANEGTHWIALAIYATQLLICDSLGGILPDSRLPKNIVSFLSPLVSTRKVVLTRQLQNPESDTCGLYCITFIHQLAKYNCICEFLQLFSSDFNKNDQVIKFLNKKIL